jgi:hypothetical protein
MSNTAQNQQAPASNTSQPRRPNEQGVISVQGYFRIFDPKNQRTLVEGRA